MHERYPADMPHRMPLREMSSHAQRVELACTLVACIAIPVIVFVVMKLMEPGPSSVVL